MKYVLSACIALSVVAAACTPSETEGDTTTSESPMPANDTSEAGLQDDLLIEHETPTDAPKDAATKKPSVHRIHGKSDAIPCSEAGPQAPRDIASLAGNNKIQFDFAPPATELNLCNIHTHTNAEHKGPGFSVFVEKEEHGGYACNGGGNLTEAEKAPAPGAYGAVEPGDTIEVHWVYTSCEATPGHTLSACIPAGCTDPALRVESQVFLLVNDENAADFMTMNYGGTVIDGLHQAKKLPDTTGTPVEFIGSTTGHDYNDQECSPYQVTWNVRQQCEKLDINSLHEWAESGNVFEETGSHDVRHLVTNPEILADMSNP